MRNRAYAATIYLLPCRRFCAKNDIGPRLLFGLEDPVVYNRWPPWSMSQPPAVTMDAGLLRRPAMQGDNGANRQCAGARPSSLARRDLGLHRRSRKHVDRGGAFPCAALVAVGQPARAGGARPQAWRASGWPCGLFGLLVTSQLPPQIRPRVENIEDARGRPSIRRLNSTMGRDGT